MASRVSVMEIIFSFDIEAGGGGISRFAVNLAQAIDQTKCQVVVCGLWNGTTQPESDRLKFLNDQGIQAFTCAPWNDRHPYRSFIKAYLALRSAIDRSPVDIVHSHSLFGDIAALWLHFENKAPAIVRTLHNELRTEWSRRPLRRLLLTNFFNPLVFDAEIGVSRFITECLDQRLLARYLKRHALTIHNAVDLSRFKQVVDARDSMRRMLGIPADAFLVGSIGRLTRQKGFDVFLDSAAQVLKTSERFYFIIVGDGEEAVLLKKQAEDIRIGNHVIFTGPRPDVENILSAMDLFICSSRWEGLSTAVLEAMAARVPIIATQIPGNLELLEPGVGAKFVPVESAIELAQAIIETSKNMALAAEYARNAYQCVQEFRIDHIARVHETLYDLIRRNHQDAKKLNHRKFDVMMRDILN